MKDICYQCEIVQEYGTMKDIDEVSFKILCDSCYSKYKEIEEMKQTNYSHLRKCQKFVGKKIKFHYTDERESDIFIPTHIDSDFEDDILLLWDDEYRYCTLEYAIENEIK